jgi:glyoxalase family protein
MGGAMAIVSGLHHVTCVVASVELAYRFYVGVLGLVPLKRTVNFDEPSVLQLYCADALGTPGTILSLLNHRDSKRAFKGTGQVSNIVFSIEKGSEGHWEDKLADNDIKLDGYGWSFGERVLCLSDPDGLALALAPSRERVVTDRKDPENPALVVGRIQSIELQTRHFEHTARLLSSLLGFYEAERDGPVIRFWSAGSNARFAVDVLCAPTHRMGTDGVGIAHHVAWLVEDLNGLKEIRARIADAGYDVSPIMDRYYFEAVYFNGPENLAFCIATKGPGLLTGGDGGDGDGLSLPPWLESRRARIVQSFAIPGRG